LAADFFLATALTGFFDAGDFVDFLAMSPNSTYFFQMARKIFHLVADLFRAIAALPAAKICGREQPRATLSVLRFQRCAETCDARHSLLNHFITRRITEPQITFGAKRATRDNPDFLRFEQPRAKVGVLETEARNIGEEIKGSLGEQTADPCDFV
jgi:hypothetical protein